MGIKNLLKKSLNRIVNTSRLKGVSFESGVVL